MLNISLLRDLRENFQLTKQMSQQNYCYILYNKDNRCTYNGYTTNLQRRIRQHNKELVGGARATTRLCKPGFSGWEYLAHVTSDDPRFDKKKALSLEWHIKYPTNKRPRPTEFQGASGRLKGLDLALANPKFAGIDFKVWYSDAATLIKQEPLPCCTDQNE
jgi:predicted GIY-YIG superfamily endonuclease